MRIAQYIFKLHNKNVFQIKPEMEDGDEYVHMRYRTRVVVEAEDDVKVLRGADAEKNPKPKPPSFSERYYHFEELVRDFFPSTSSLIFTTVLYTVNGNKTNLYLFT